MKTSRIVALATGIALSFGSMAFAITDVQDFSTQTPTTYFLDQDLNKKNNNLPYYRYGTAFLALNPYYNGGDWGWNHNAISGTITSATLNISAFDVDWPGQPQNGLLGELDKIYAYDNGVKTLLGSLTGLNDTWSYTTFILGSNFYNDINSGLQVWMEIDNRTEGWAVSLAKSALATDGSGIPDPDPTGSNPVPEPSTMILLGGGLAGLAYWKRKKSAKSN